MKPNIKPQLALISAAVNNSFLSNNTPSYTNRKYSEYENNSVGIGNRKNLSVHENVAQNFKNF